MVISNSLRKRGFTLIELMVVIAVIAILATIALFGIGAAQRAARDTQRQQIMNSLRSSLERFYGDNSTYPAGHFSTMLLSLSTFAGYTVPPTDPGCGGGKVVWSLSTAANGAWIPCNSATQASYWYTTGGTGYTLSLFKEAGGNSIFLNPQ